MCKSRPLLESFAFRVTLVACLIFALFGGGLFVIFDIPDDPGIPILDTLMIIAPWERSATLI